MATQLDLENVDTVFNLSSLVVTGLDRSELPNELIEVSVNDVGVLQLTFRHI